MQDDLVSIVIPVYNSERFLSESIESALNQTYKNIEVIVVDDGSIDNSQEIIKQYSDKIISIKQENSGLASALNLGINKMTGKWFKWFSPDDTMWSLVVGAAAGSTHRRFRGICRDIRHNLSTDATD